MCVRPKVSLSLLRFCWVLDYSWSVLLVKAEDATSIHRKKLPLRLRSINRLSQSFSKEWVGLQLWLAS